MDTSAMLSPRSADEAVAALRETEPLTIVGGGTVVVPDLRAGRIERTPVLMLRDAGLDTIGASDGVLRIGACVPVDRLGATPEPLPTVAAGLGDAEIRAQATVGGNLCARSTTNVPRGDLQAPLIALDARARVATATDERVLRVEDFVAESPAGYLVLSVEIEQVPRIAGSARLERPHTHSYTALQVCASAQLQQGKITSARVVAGGLCDVPVRLTAVEQALAERAVDDADPAAAAARATEGIQPRTDALASAWYRERVLPVLVRKACTRMLDGGQQS